MKKIFLSIITLSLVTSGAVAQKKGSAGKPKNNKVTKTATSREESFRSIRPKAGPAPEIKLGDATRFTLANGLKVFVVENHKVPKVSFSIDLDIKPESEGDRAGLYNMVGQMLTAGTQRLSKEEFAEQTDFIGASIEGSSDGMYGRSLTVHQDEMLALMSEALLHPAFKQEELSKLLTQAKSGEEANKNDADHMLENVSKIINYGKGHPYGAIMTDKTLDNIKLDDIKKYYSTYFHPNTAYLAIVGDITAAKAKALAEQYFGGWEKADVPVTRYPEANFPADRKVYFVPREGAVQSVVSVTYPVAFTPGNPDAISGRVANAILGGSSEGLLFQNLREKHGWTYGAYSSLKADDNIGEFQAYAKARNAVTDSSVNEIISEMNFMRTQDIDKTELSNTLNYLTGRFAIGLESPSTIASYAINIDKYHLPADYYKNYLKNLNAVTAADVKTVSARYFKPEQANIIVVGAKSEADKLKRFSSDNTVHFIDAYGNPITDEAPKAAAEGVTAGTVMDKYIAAIGGKTAVEQLKDLSISGTMEAQGQSMKIELKRATPDKSLMVLSHPQYGQIVKVVYNNGKGSMTQMGQTQDMDASQLSEAAEEADIQADLHPEQYGYTFKLTGIEKVDGKEANVIERKDKDGKTATFYYDAATGLLVKSLSTESAEGQTFTKTTLYADYKEVKGGNGYKIPFQMTISVAGTDRNLKVVTAEANKGLSAGDFK